MKRLRKGDQVIVITGKDKNKIGKILKISDEKIIVEGINMKYKHLSKEKYGKSEIVQSEAWIHESNVAYYNGETKSKIGYKLYENKKTRYMKKTNEVIL